MAASSTLELKVPPPVVLLLVALTMWIAARWAPAFAVDLPARTAIASGFALVGVGLGVAGVLRFRRAGTTVNPMRPGSTSSLVDSGVYRFSRNPIYLGDLLVLIGWAAWLSNGLSLLLAVAFVAYINRFQIEPEERALAELFGADFNAYRSKVRRWI